MRSRADGPAAGGGHLGAGRCGFESGGPAAGARGQPDGEGDRVVEEPRPGMTVSQLAEASGVGVPSIHHYRKLGLLPPPVQVSANLFHYDERHVEVLRMIRLLRERRGMPLAAIRDVLPDLLVTGGSEAVAVERWDAVLAISEVADEEHHHEVRARLLQVARVAFAGRGYGGVNVEELCQRAGIAKGSFYRHFVSKDAIYLAAVRSVVDVVDEAVARWRRSLTPDAAVDAVAGVLEPVMPLLLEVVVRAGHGDDALAGAVPETVAGIARSIAPRLAVGDGSAVLTIAGQVARRAVDVLVERAMGLGQLGL